MAHSFVTSLVICTFLHLLRSNIEQESVGPIPVTDIDVIQSVVCLKERASGASGLVSEAEPVELAFQRSNRIRSQKFKIQDYFIISSEKLKRTLSNNARQD